ncbi:MAG: hypothetical protein AAF633_00415 [Chloroflexota bacterium]
MLNFADYDVSPKRGFLPAEDPLTELPPAFAEWDRLGRELPYLVLTGRVRRTLADFKTPDLEQLTTQGELERAMLIMSSLGMAYIWAEAPEIEVLPAHIAVPWAALGERLGRPPIITHSSAVLNNWRRLDPNDGIHADNLACTQHFMGGMDEQWFFTATTALEAIGAPALKPLAEAKVAAAGGDGKKVASLLEEVLPIFKAVNAALLRVYERCEPFIFYNRIRIFLAGWDQTGILFEGVSETPLKLHGGSAAQSSLIQAYDAALGIEHLHPETRPFLMLMRAYMPPDHRRFVEDLAKGESIHDCVQAHGRTCPKLVDLFNRCIDELEEFRKAHMGIAVRYVLKQGKNGEDGLGTGGTSFVPFLREARNETIRKKV